MKTSVLCKYDAIYGSGVARGPPARSAISGGACAIVASLIFKKLLVSAHGLRP
jgi:hypothetical protein